MLIKTEEKYIFISLILHSISLKFSMIFSTLDGEYVIFPTFFMSFHEFFNIFFLHFSRIVSVCQTKIIFVTRCAFNLNLPHSLIRNSLFYLFYETFIVFVWKFHCNLMRNKVYIVKKLNKKKKNTTTNEVGSFLHHLYVLLKLLILFLRKIKCLLGRRWRYKEEEEWSQDREQLNSVKMDYKRRLTEFWNCNVMSAKEKNFVFFLFDFIVETIYKEKFPESLVNLEVWSWVDEKNNRKKDIHLLLLFCVASRL
jgi:hypothetical protein